MTESVIEIEKVSLSFPRRKSLVQLILGLLNKQPNEFTALNSINLDIKQGEIIGVIGTNGCGKSTLLRVISGIYPPDHGHCKVKGNISLLAGLGTGFSGHQTGRENAILYASILGYSEEKIISF